MTSDMISGVYNYLGRQKEKKISVFTYVINFNNFYLFFCNFG